MRDQRYQRDQTVSFVSKLAPENISSILKNSFISGLEIKLSTERDLYTRKY